MLQRTVSSLFKAMRTSGLSLFAGLLAAACTQATPSTVGADTFEEISGDQVSFGGTGKLDNQATAELATYKSDWRYVNSLVSSDTAVTLNHADERQHRFVTMRLKLAGKTRENSPELYKILDDLRNEHLAKGLKPGVLASIQSGSSSPSLTQGRVNQHFLPAVQLRQSSATMLVIATASRIDPLYYGYIDAAASDANGTPLGTMSYVEVYSNMPYTNVRSLGDLSLTQLKSYEGDSLLMEDTVQYGYRETYVHLGSDYGPNFDVPPNSITFDPSPTIDAPVNTVGDSCISICLNRTWTGDCDYDLTSSTMALKIPIKGSTTITSADYKFDTAKIGQYKAGTAVDSMGTPDPGGAIRTVLKSAAGGCAAIGTGFTLPMTQFWSTVTTSTDGKTMSWNMTGTNEAVFSSECRLVEDFLELDILIVRPWSYPLTSGSFAKGITPMIITNNEAVPSRVLPCMKVTNSCLAAGTMIEMADGRSQTIESIQDGDRVHTPYHGGDMGLTVADTAKGFELVPMVHIEDQAGRSLLLTEMHPIQVVGRGMVLAKYLQVGDMVVTKSGPSRLVRVSRERYDGTVHNLKVGSSAEIRSLDKDQTVVYANGFLVGDGQIQSKYEAIERSASAQPARVRLPSRWYKDYMNSARR